MLGLSACSEKFLQHELTGDSITQEELDGLGNTMVERVRGLYALMIQYGGDHQHFGQKSIDISLGGSDNQTSVVVDGRGILIVGISSSKLYVKINISGNSSISFKYIKLELGSLATPFTPRPYAEELLLCQRYFQRRRIQGNTASGTGGTRFYPAVVLTCDVRSSYTISNITLPTIRGNGYSATASSISVNRIDGNLLQLAVDCTENLTLNECYVLSNGFFDLDCEIY